MTGSPFEYQINIQLYVMKESNEEKPRTGVNWSQ